MARYASAEEFLEGLGGQIYKAVQPEPVSDARLGGWGSSNRRPQSLSLAFHVGPKRQEISVESRAGRPHSSSLLANMLLSRQVFVPDAAALPYTFTATIEESAATLVVDGAEREFTVLVCNEMSVAFAEVDGSGITIEAPHSLVPALALARIGPQSLAPLIEEANEKRRANAERYGWNA